MLILTIQKRQVIEELNSGVYVPDFWKSDFSCMTVNATKGYRKVLSALEKRADLSFTQNETCFWGWVSNPYKNFHKMDNDLVALFCEIPKEKVVCSDYDKFTEYILEESSDSHFLDTECIMGDCIQCSFAWCSVERVVAEVDYDIIRNLNGSVEELLRKTTILNILRSALGNKYSFAC